MNIFKFVAMCIILVATTVSSFPAIAENGVTDKEIVIGMSTALSGPSGYLGTSFSSGVNLYLNMLNASGGVYGRKIRLIIYDDRYEPAMAVSNINKLVKDDSVFCLLGNVGTPTTLAIRPILNEQKVPLFAPFTGADSLRRPVDRYIFHYRASYNQETETFIHGMADILGYKKIAVFYQDDGYGKAVLEGTRLALEKRGLKPVSIGAYTRNFEDVIPAMDSIMNDRPDAVVMAGTYSACSRFIRSWKRKAILSGSPKDLDPVFMNVSFVGPDRLAALLENYGNGVVVTQVVPPFAQGGSKLPAVNEYLSALNKFSPNGLPNFGSFEGFIATKIFVEALQRTGKNLTRESLIQKTEEIKDLDIQTGNTISFSSANHQGSQAVYPTVLQNGIFLPLIDWHMVKPR